MTSKVNNPTEVTITNLNIINNINRYLVYRKKITLEITSVIIPKLVNFTSEFLIVTTNGWNFQPYSYININTYSCLGLINVSKIKQYVQNQSTSAYHSVDVGDKEKPGIGPSDR